MFLKLIRLLAPALPLLFILPHSLGLLPVELITALDRRLHDMRLEWMAPEPQHDERIVIVDIDEASLQSIGRWPWSRQTMGELASELLQKQQAAVVGFDVLFADSVSDARIAHIRSAIATLAERGDIAPDEWQTLQRAWDDDHHFADALRNQPAVLGFYVSPGQSPIRTGELPPPLPLLTRPAGHFPQLHPIHGYTANVSILARAAPRAGFINAFSDSDGVLRSIPLIMRSSTGTAAHTGLHADAHYQAALSLRMFMQALGVNTIALQSIGAHPPSRTAALQLGGVILTQAGSELLLPTATNGAVMVPFRGKGGASAGHYRYISAADVLQGKLHAGSLAGKLVLVGTSAPGLSDIRITPLDRQFPGVEVHATLLSAMLDGRIYYQPDYARGYAVATTAIATLLLVLALPYLHMLGALLFCAALAAACLALTFWLYATQGLVLPVAATLLGILLSYVIHAVTSYILVSRTRGQLVELFGHYVPSELVRRMAQSPHTYSMHAQSQELTILFCDVHHFTQLSEHMAPENLQELLNRLFDHMAEVIASSNGTIDKYIGDCVMVFWGAPLPDSQHALHAAEAALKLQHMLNSFNAGQRQAQQPELRLGIGINTGVVSVGDMGSSIRRSYTVIGDAVNVAARLEPLSKCYGLDVVAGARTAELASTLVWQWVDKVQVTGRRQAIDVYTPLGRQADAYRYSQELALWHTFCQAYQQRKWSDCARLLQPLRRIFPDKQLYQIYEVRIARFCMSPPPPDWNGASAIQKNA